MNRDRLLPKDVVKRDLLSRHLEQLDRQSLQGKTTEEVRSLMYMQGVVEALDNLEVQELLKALKDDSEGSLLA